MVALLGRKCSQKMNFGDRFSPPMFRAKCTPPRMRTHPGTGLLLELFNSSIDALLEVALTITAGDSNGQQSHLPHTLEPRVDEFFFFFEVQSTVPG